jgi:hypothetical protein
VTVDPAVSGGIVPSSLQADFGFTNAYARYMVTQGPESWCWYLLPGWLPLATGHATIPPNRLDFYSIPPPPPDGPGVKIVSVLISLRGANPLEPLAANYPIKGDFTIDVKECGGHAWVKWSGRRTNFPWHEIYIDAIPLHQFDPEASGYGPDALTQPPVFVGSNGWIQLY